MSKSSANPRRYSKGADAIDKSQPLTVHIELRCDKSAVATLDGRLRYLMSRWQHAHVDVLGIRREGAGVVATLGVFMGELEDALSGTSKFLRPGYNLIWDIWVQMPEYTPVFCPPPGESDKAAAALLGFYPDVTEEAS